jgi:hypothetical protein
MYLSTRPSHLHAQQAVVAGAAGGVPAFQSSYKLDDVWSPESKERLRRNIAGPG